MFDTRTRLFFFACLKDAAGAGAALKSAAQALAPTSKKIGSGSGAALKVAAPAPGSGSATLGSTALNFTCKLCFGTCQKRHLRLHNTAWCPTLNYFFNFVFQESPLWLDDKGWKASRRESPVTSFLQLCFVCHLEYGVQGFCAHSCSVG